MNENKLHLITALVDGELKDSSREEELKSLIEEDFDLQFEFKVQQLVKSIVSERFAISPAPERITKKIIKKINPSEKKSSSIIDKLVQLASPRPAIAFGSVIVIILAIILLLINLPTHVDAPVNLAEEQVGEENMYVQAKNNFRRILAGTLQPQLVTDKPEEIEKFFIDEGVRYKTLIPRFDKWNLVGAVVSVDQGEKFAHHVYADDAGRLVYLFQVDESYIDKHHILKLSDNLLKRLDEGHCFDAIDNDLSTLMTKVDNNIFAVVSNMPVTELEAAFCNLN